MPDDIDGTGVKGGSPSPEDLAGLAGKVGDTLPDEPPGDKPPAADPGDGKTTEELDFIEKDGVKYYKSFDKHPEWRELKDTKSAVSSILSENGYTDIDELVADLKRGSSLAELIGTTDANAVQGLLDKAQKWEAAEEYWAEQEAAKLEEGETQEETIARLKDEIKAERAARRTDLESREAQLETMQQLQAFNQDVGSLVENAEGLTDSEKSILKLHLGVDNPMDEVDIGDRKAVRATANDVISQFRDFIKGVRQAAIDEYTAGKSKIVPTPPAAGDQTPAVEAKKIEIKEGTTVEEAIGAANKLLIEQFTQMK